MKIVNISWETRKKLEMLLGVKAEKSQREEELWSIVSKYQKYFYKLPGIASICVCNSLSYNACNYDSDIDLFIISKKNRLWTARFYITLTTLLFGIRKSEKTHRNRFCLSFFVSEEEKNFWDIAIDNDIYLAYWREKLIPIMQRDESFENFWKNNAWNSNTSENFLKKESRKNIITKLWDIQEMFICYIWLKKTKKSYEKFGKPYGVIIRDTMLKFHNDDRRKELRDKVLSQQ